MYNRDANGDEAKDRSNCRKHGISCDEARTAFLDEKMRTPAWTDN